MHPLTTRILHQQQSSSKHRNITQNYVQHQNSSRHVPVHWNPFSKGTTWGECTYKGIPILPQHFPLYSSREVVPLLPYLLHLCMSDDIHYMWMRESPLRGECRPYFLLDHTCTPPRMLHVWTLIDKKRRKKYLKYCIYMYFGGQQTFPKYKRYSYGVIVFYWSLARAGRDILSTLLPSCISFKASPQEHHVNVCPPQYRTSNKHNSNT